MNFDGVCSLWGETSFYLLIFSIYVGIYGDLWGKVGERVSGLRCSCVSDKEVW